MPFRISLPWGVILRRSFMVKMNCGMEGLLQRDAGSCVNAGAAGRAGLVRSFPVDGPVAPRDLVPVDVIEELRDVFLPTAVVLREGMVGHVAETTSGLAPTHTPSSSESMMASCQRSSYGSWTSAAHVL